MTGPTVRRIMNTGFGRLVLVMWLLMTAVAAEAVQVTTFTSTNVPLTIPQVPAATGIQRGRTESTIQIAGVQTALSKVTVSLYIVHQWPGDLVLTLIPPGGGAGIILARRMGGNNRAGGFQTGYGTGNAAAPAGQVVFDSDVLLTPAINPTPGSEYILSGTYSPLQTLGSLSGLTGNQVNGTWTLRVDDEANEDSGTLRAWSITFTEPGPHTWTGASTTDTNWSTAANWLDDNLPALNEVGAVLLFPDNVVPPASRIANNNIGDIRVGKLTVEGSYTLTASGAGKISMTNTSNIFANIGTGTVVDCSMPIDLAGATTITVAQSQTLNMSGIIANNAVTEIGSLVFAGLGTSRLSGANAYTGATTVNAGVLAITSNTALGTAAAGTTVAVNATLRVESAVTTTEPLALAGTGSAGQGALATTVTATWGGPITLVGTGTGFGPGGSVLTISDVAASAAGYYGFLEIGAGTVVLGAALPVNTLLSADGGRVMVNVGQPNLSGLTLSGNAVIDSGANLMTVKGSGIIAVTASASATGAQINGLLELGTGGHALTIAGGSLLTMGATVTGTGGLGLSGGGTLTWPTNSPGVPIGISSGRLVGAGTLGDLSVTSGAVEPTGVLNTGSINLGSDSWLIINNGTSLNATGSVALGGGVMQPFTQTGTLIANDGNDPVTGTFRSLPLTNSILSYAGGSNNNDVVFSGAGGSTVTFGTNTTYSAAESAGTIQIILTATGNMTVAISSVGGGAVVGGDFTVPAVITVGVGTTMVPVTILDDFIQEGTEIANLVIIPLSGGYLLSPANASLTITDNDQSDQKKCGFGTGLTVFLLLGFGLFFHLRLRRH